MNMNNHIEPGDIYEIAKQNLPTEDISHHESDLYIRMTPESSKIINCLKDEQGRLPALLSTFTSQTDGTINMWYDLPFCYIPFFEEKKRKHEITEKIHTIFKRMKKNDWKIEHVAGNEYSFRKFSPAGCDFSIEIDIGNDIETFKQNVLKYYEDFDVSSETYMWLDENGHGRNGAPYNMKDVYEDTEACEEMIYELYNIIEETEDKDNGK